MIAMQHPSMIELLRPKQYELVNINETVHENNWQRYLFICVGNIYYWQYL